MPRLLEWINWKSSPRRPYFMPLMPSPRVSDARDKAHCDLTSCLRGTWGERSEVSMYISLSLSSPPPSFSLAYPLSVSVSLTQDTLTHSVTSRSRVWWRYTLVYSFQLIFIIWHMVVTTNMVKTTNGKEIGGSQWKAQVKERVPLQYKHITLSVLYDWNQALESRGPAGPAWINGQTHWD